MGEEFFWRDAGKGDGKGKGSVRREDEEWGIWRGLRDSSEFLSRAANEVVDDDIEDELGCIERGE